MPVHETHHARPSAAERPLDHDVVVVGGGAAGLSGAIALARSRRDVLVVDAGEPRNAPAEGVHNLLGLEGISPAELLERGRATLQEYAGQVRRARAVGAERLAAGPNGAAGFAVHLDDGTAVTARRLLVTTGLVDHLPDLPGVAERWGHQVLHCPFCHGWEVRDQRVAVLATGPAASHQALLFARLTDRVVLLEHEAPPSPEDRTRLASAGVEVVAATVVGLEGPEGGPVEVRLQDHDPLVVDAVVVAPRMEAVSPVLDDLGLHAVDHPSGMGRHHPSEAMGATTVPGLRLAGNVTDLSAQVAVASAAGLMAGAALHGELVEADLADRAARLPVDAGPATR